MCGVGEALGLSKRQQLSCIACACCVPLLSLTLIHKTSIIPKYCLRIIIISTPLRGHSAALNKAVLPTAKIAMISCCLQL